MNKVKLLFFMFASIMLLGCNNANRREGEGLNSQEDSATMESVVATDSFVEAVNQSELYERKKTELHNQMILCCSNDREKEQVDKEWTAYENVERQMAKIASNLGNLLFWGGVSGPAYFANDMYRQVVEARIKMYQNLVEVKLDSILNIDDAYYVPTEEFFFDCMDSTVVKAAKVMEDDDSIDSRFRDDEDRQHFFEMLEETKSAVKELRTLISIWKNTIVKSDFFMSHTHCKDCVERLASEMLIRWACAGVSCTRSLT